MVSRNWTQKKLSQVCTTVEYSENYIKIIYLTVPYVVTEDEKDACICDDRLSKNFFSYITNYQSSYINILQNLHHSCISLVHLSISQIAVYVSAPSSLVDYVTGVVYEHCVSSAVLAPPPCAAA